MKILEWFFIIGWFLGGFGLGIISGLLIENCKREKKIKQMLDDYEKYLADREELERLCKSENNDLGLREVKISKEFNIKADYNDEYVKMELVLLLAKELVKHLKIRSEVNEKLKTKRLTYIIQFLEQVKENE